MYIIIKAQLILPNVCRMITLKVLGGWHIMEMRMKSMRTWKRKK
jgi:hypothetical protein